MLRTRTVGLAAARDMVDAEKGALRERHQLSANTVINHVYSRRAELEIVPTRNGTDSTGVSVCAFEAKSHLLMNACGT